MIFRSAFWSGLTVAVIAMLVGFPLCLVSDTIQRFAEIFGMNTREDTFASLGLFVLTLALVGFLIGGGYRVWRLRGIAEPGAAPNGGPATQLGDSGTTEGPPSVN